MRGRREERGESREGKVGGRARGRGERERRERKVGERVRGIQMGRSRDEENRIERERERPKEVE